VDIIITERVNSIEHEHRLEYAKAPMISVLNRIIGAFVIYAKNREKEVVFYLIVSLFLTPA